MSETEAIQTVVAYLGRQFMPVHVQEAYRLLRDRPEPVRYALREGHGMQPHPSGSFYRITE